MCSRKKLTSKCARKLELKLVNLGKVFQGGSACCTTKMMARSSVFPCSRKARQQRLHCHASCLGQRQAYSSPEPLMPPPPQALLPDSSCMSHPSSATAAGGHCYFCVPNASAIANKLQPETKSEPRFGVGKRTQIWDCKLQKMNWRAHF